MSRQLLMLNQNIIVGLCWECVTLTNQFISDKILWLAPQLWASKKFSSESDRYFTLPWHRSEWNLCKNDSKLQLSSGVATSSRQFLLWTFDSIFAHYFSLIICIIILFVTFKGALHKEIIHDHQIKKNTGDDSILG